MAYNGMYFQRPENVLKRAEDFIKINKSGQALELLFELLNQRKFRNWQPAHEDVMKRFLELCVDSRNNRMAKEGLHQYRNLCQHQSPGSLEVVIEHMLMLAEGRAKKAAAECNSRVVDSVDDLENDKTPEAILLASVSSEQGKERNEREHLVPWLKFLWESYRSTLEILRHNIKLENVYQRTAFRTFDFCVQYERNTEFRKLCDTLRTHTNKSRDTDPSAETIEFQLATRFEQLRVSSILRLWNEGFRTIEDIHNIFQKTDKRPSSQLEATYYQKLTDLFLVSENFLFHAYAYKAYYLLSVEKNKSLTKEQSSIMGSCVLLSAMSIPLQSAKAGTTYSHRDSQKQKNRRMAQLLGFDINPKRKSILQDLLDNDILDVVLDDVRELYVALEVTFAPLDLINKVVPLLEKIKTVDESLVHYVGALEKLLIIRVLSQLSEVFYSVRLDTLESLLKPLNKPFLQIEDIIVKAVKSRQVDVHSVRIDHMSNCIHFGEDFMEENRTRHLLTDMSRGLNSVCSLLEDQSRAHLLAEQRRARSATVLQYIDQTHKEVLGRKEIIDKRKEEYMRVQQARRADQERRKKEAERSRKEAEQARIEKSRLEREKAALDAIEKEAKSFDLKQRMIQEGIDVNSSSVLNMTPEEQNKLIEETRKKTIQESIDSEKKIQDAAKRLDGLVRAMREKSIPKLRVLAKERLKEDEALHNERWAQHIEQSKTDHENAIKAKHQYSAMQEKRESFESKLLTRWNAAHEEDKERRWREIDQRLKTAKIERGRKTMQRRQKEIQRKKDEEARIEREKARIKEEEERRLAREQEAPQEPRSDDRMPASRSDRYVPRTHTEDMPPSDDRFGGDRGGDRFGGDRFGGDRGGGDRGGDRYGGDRGGDRFGGERGGDRFGGERGGDRFGGERGGSHAFGGDRGGDRGDRFGGDRFGGDRGGDRFGGD
eukprot:CAMPEP_0184540526 /NCGR_PEP_ID=MMETSP0199_2-20130426/699_1 /TAXON_ID=1112570 /ORGANISM="Thraustochytrium sp., Strain LLF1b" /LENGTH=939 /DNA_ID=CAMNT_0026934135 /DNA_START=82 /DNA_END=2898 /DNA_ORIENTATION=+